MHPQRLTAAIIAAVASLVLVVLAGFSTLPFVAYRPGPTFDILADAGNGKAIVEVSGHKIYPTTGQLRFVTVSVDAPSAPHRSEGKSLGEILKAWLSPTEAIYPYAAVYPDAETPQQSQTDGQVEMVSSQDAAKAVALHELGYKFPEYVEVTSVQSGAPADGKLEVRDLVQEVDGTKVTDTDQVVKAITGAKPGQAVDFTVLRDGETVSVPVIPQVTDDKQLIGVQLGPGYDFPFSISLDVDPNIGGPSAGLMFSLAIYDTLTPGSLTGGGEIAGTGVINTDGTVGPIGGIQQKIAGSRRDGAQLFLVPSANCGDSMGAHNGSMRLVKVTTMHSALTSIKAWAEDHDAKLPTCGGGS